MRSTSVGAGNVFIEAAGKLKAYGVDINKSL